MSGSDDQYGVVEDEDNEDPDGWGLYKASYKDSGVDPFTFVEALVPMKVVYPPAVVPDPVFIPVESDLEVVRSFLRKYGVPKNALVGGWAELRGFIRRRLG